MAGSRRDKLGSIFSRMTGLLRSGAIKEEDRPIWYDVVKAYPPKPKPPPKQNIPNILYPEDFVRVHFYNTYSDPGATRLSNETVKSIQQRFVDQYLALHEEKSVPSDQLFKETVRLMEEQGVKLITHEQKKAAAQTPQRRDRDRQLQSQQDDPISATFVKSDPKQQPGQSSSSKVDLQSLFEEPR
ncbi:28S ribosomal protein s23, mitochondrial-like [Plakobranchus ocellatus]|uniref:Small ribosomal subunit protein mS23 n=1 Tax=Plakobranchus ocellatus TaxID=259542 RepID=A0AAV4BSW9_9GAST|nr:28S ribosomal protein s23, mitochondrial-like [Plakobranchus ocellatus]